MRASLKNIYALSLRPHTCQRQFFSIVIYVQLSVWKTLKLAVFSSSLLRLQSYLCVAFCKLIKINQEVSEMEKNSPSISFDILPNASPTTINFFFVWGSMQFKQVSFFVSFKLFRVSFLRVIITVSPENSKFSFWRGVPLKTWWFDHT